MTGLGRIQSDRFAAEINNSGPSHAARLNVAFPESATPKLTFRLRPGSAEAARRMGAMATTL
jgi:hypothetical protein